MPVDNAVCLLMLQLAPADADGRYSLSLAHDYLVPAIDAARVVLAEVNDQAPWTFGERSLGAADLDLIVHTSHAPLASPATPATNIERAVAARAAALIENGATLQFGIGNIPEAILSQLADRRDLGVHSGALLDAAARLAQAGVITNARKSIEAALSAFRKNDNGARVDAAITNLRLVGIEFDAKTLRVIAEADGTVKVAVSALP